jgi:hypothetical protein
MYNDNYSDNDSDTLIMDNKWINQEKEYNIFYKEKLTSIKLYFIYVNTQDIVEYVKNDTYLFPSPQEEKSILQKDVLLSIIKNNMVLNGRDYKLISLLKYNLDIVPEDIIRMKLDNNDYLSCENEIKNIEFYDTIGIFQDINSLFFVFQERIHIKQQQHTTTKKIYIHQHRQNIKNTIKNNTIKNNTIKNNTIKNKKKVLFM